MRRGAALLATLLALALTSAMAVGSVFVARKHAAAARIANAGVALTPTAERAIAETLAQWDSVARGGQAIGATDSLSQLDVVVWVTRTNDLEYWIVSEARAARSPVLYARIGLSVAISSGRPRPAFPRGWSRLP